GGGQVDISNGNFVFEVSEAYEIENGRIGRPLKGATLIGVGPEALKNVSMVGSDPMPDPGMGTCGKDGQMVPVGVGLPTLRIDNLTVGGTRVKGWDGTTNSWPRASSSARKSAALSKPKRTSRSAGNAVAAYAAAT